jgi:hypothetical protein
VTKWLEHRRTAIEAGALAAALVVTFVLLFADRGLAQYVDESDNLLGGLIIARGYRLYVDFFSQHMPLPYLVTAVGWRLGLSDLVGFRVLFAVLVVLFFGYVCLQFRRRLSPVLLIVLVLTYGIAHPMFSGYMLLADHFFALALLLVVLFVLAYDVDFSVSAQVAISLACFVALASTLISAYPILLIALYYVVRKVSRHLRGGPRIRWRHEAVFVAILLAPLVWLVVWLVARGEAGALIDQAIRFNQIYYARYDLGGNPIEILLKSVTSFKDVVVQYLRPGALREVETFLLIGNIAAVLVVWKKRDLLFAAFYVGLVIVSRMRGAGYHGSPYFLVSFASIAIVLAYAADAAIRMARQRFAAGARSASPRAVGPGQALVGLVLVGFVGLAAVFYHDIAGFYLHLPRAAGDSGDVQVTFASVVDAATAPGDRLWAAPFEPYLYLKANRLPVSPYWYYHPWMSDSPEVTDGILRDLQAAPPPLIIFQADKDIPWDFPLPTPREYGARVFAFITSGYAALDEQDPVLRDVFVRRDRMDAVRAELEQRGILKQTAEAAATRDQ